MINKSSREECCGCTACASICPQNAITMRPDNMGFLYPNVDMDKCIECGMCEKVCSFNSKYDKSLNFNEPIAYAARHKDMKQLESSRSGAAFIAISDVILSSGGVVYGTGYENHFRVVHKRAINKDQRDEFKGSKYVQSDMSGVFRRVMQDLKDGQIVLFSGTPCQTSGLRSYIGKSLSKNLFLIDIICHGVPSPYIWRDYISYIEGKYNCDIVKVNFRDKNEFGWRDHIETYELSSGGKINSRGFTYLFYKHIIFRNSCGTCFFANTVRPSDITIGDYWGWEKTDPKFNIDDKGVSLVFVNTEKGRCLFEKAKSDLWIIPTNIDKCMQPNLEHPSKLNVESPKFESDYIKKGFKYVMTKYGNIGIRYKIVVFLRRMIKKIFLNCTSSNKM